MLTMFCCDLTVAFLLPQTDSALRHGLEHLILAVIFLRNWAVRLLFDTFVAWALSAASYEGYIVSTQTIEDF
jgi:hypothetical protein